MNRSVVEFPQYVFLRIKQFLRIKKHHSSLAIVRLYRLLFTRIARGAIGISLALTIVIAGANLWIIEYSSDYIFDLSYRESEKNGVVIVPGAFVRGLRPSSILQERLECALKLYRDGNVSSILVSGDHSGAYDEVGAMQNWLLNHDVPLDDIITDHAGFRTLHTMNRAYTVHGVRRAVICTQRFHLARAVFLARRLGIDAKGVIADRTRPPEFLKNECREILAGSVAIFDSYIRSR